MSERSPERRFEAALRWYPKAWRARYGAELTALLVDTYGDAPVPRRERIALARAGVAERGRHIWNGAPWHSGPDRVRDSAGLVLWAWALTVIGGIGFAKSAEHWSAAVPVHERALAATAYRAVVVAALAGAAVIAIAVAVSLPPFLRSLRARRSSAFRRPLSVATVCTGCTVVAGVVIVAWAHHLTSVARNGGSTPYAAVASLGAALVVATVVAWTYAALRAAATIELPEPTIRTLGLLGLLLAVVIGVVLAGTVAWWIAMAMRGPSFLGTGAHGTGLRLPAGLVGAESLMVSGAALASRGAWRVVASLRRPDART